MPILSLKKIKDQDDDSKTQTQLILTLNLTVDFFHCHRRKEVSLKKKSDVTHQSKSQH